MKRFLLLATPAIAIILLASAMDAAAAEVTVNRPTISGRPVDRCIREGTDRCGTNARERVADEVCRTNGFVDAVNGSVDHDGGLPRSVSIFDSRQRRFVAGWGADTISRVRCITPDPILTLTAPANNTRVKTEPSSGSTPIKMRATQVATNLTWTGRNLLTAHFIVGCLQRSQSFDNARYDCNATVASWSGDFRMTSKPVLFSDIQNQAGRTLFWSVRACEPSPNGPIVTNGQRFACTNWVTPRNLVVEAATPPPPNAATWEAIRPAFQSASCTNCHELSNLMGSNEQQQLTVRTVVSAHPTGRPVTCTGCHQDALVRTGLPGNLLNVSWHVPSNSLRFRNRSSADLCRMADDVPPSAPSVRDHLTRDPLILWAVNGGPQPPTAREPGRPANAVRAFNGGVSSWINAVNAWVNAGMPCP